MSYEHSYLKYKAKYLQLKQLQLQKGGNINWWFRKRDDAQFIFYRPDNHSHEKLILEKANIFGKEKKIYHCIKLYSDTDKQLENYEMIIYKTSDDMPTHFICENTKTNDNLYEFVYASWYPDNIVNNNTFNVHIVYPKYNEFYVPNINNIAVYNYYVTYSLTSVKLTLSDGTKYNIFFTKCGENIRATLSESSHEYIVFVNARYTEKSAQEIYKSCDPKHDNNLSTPTHTHIPAHIPSTPAYTHIPVVIPSTPAYSHSSKASDKAYEKIMREYNQLPPSSSKLTEAERMLRAPGIVPNELTKLTERHYKNKKRY